MTTTSTLLSELSRVFGQHATLVESYPRSNACAVHVDGWHDEATYEIMPAIRVLRTYRDGAGATETGAKVVRDDLEQQGAVLSERAVMLAVDREKSAGESN